MGNDPDMTGASADTGSKKSELFMRIISAVVLVIVSLALTVWSPTSFIILVAVGVVFMAWEWRRLTSGQGEEQILTLTLGIHMFGVLGALILIYLGQGTPALGLLFFAAIVLFLFPGKVDRAFSFLGPFYTGLPALALVWLRGDPQYGVVAVLFVFAVVWMADIGAYAVGRTIGGPKLSPRISPNKTWSGALGGLTACALVAVFTAKYLDNSSIVMLIGVALVLGIASQIGDLYESSIKRRFKIKDSSNLIPGHGGILDRVDGLIVAALIAALIALFVNPQAPGHGILVW